MGKKKNMIIALIGFVLQILMMVTYSFSSMQISGVVYIIAWLVCALIVRNVLNEKKVI